MKTLHLLRHAKSSWNDPALPDADRPLAPRGRRAAAALRDHFSATGLAVDLVICSPARRTRETWDAVRAGLHAEADLRLEPKVYEASVGQLVELVQAVPESIGSMLLVGHNPGLEQLAAFLTGDAERHAREKLDEGFPTGGLATLSFETSWRDVGRGTGRLVSFVRPRDFTG